MYDGDCGEGLVAIFFGVMACSIIALLFLLFVLSTVHLLGFQVFEMQGVDAVNFAWIWFGAGAAFIAFLSVWGVVAAVGSCRCVSAGEVVGLGADLVGVSRGCVGGVMVDNKSEGGEVCLTDVAGGFGNS